MENHRNIYYIDIRIKKTVATANHSTPIDKEMIKMTSMILKFECPHEVVDFVNTISHCSYDADIRYGSRIVDAKSILGVITLAVCHTVELVLHTEKDNCTDIISQLSAFAA